MTRGELVVLSGPSGVGKGTVVAQLRRLRPDVWVSVSATTRAPRPGEVPGVSYHFWDDQLFTSTAAAGGFLETAAFADNRYGTPRRPVDEHRDSGESVLLEIELHGARQVREAVPDAMLVFLAPPDFDTLAARLRGRGTEDHAAIQRRLERAREEMAAAAEFDAVVVNDDVTRAAAELVDLIDHAGRSA